jgi:hypothetical protein
MAVDEETFVQQCVDELVSLDKQGAWDGCLEIEDAPVEFDILIKDWSYEPITINVEEKNYGSVQVAPPMNAERVTLTMTARDTKNKKLYKWLKWLASQIVHSDGTFGIPFQYVKRVRVFSSTNKDDDPDPDEFFMIFTNIGEMSKDRSSREHFEFPITWSQYKTSGFEQESDTVNPFNLDQFGAAY